MHATTQIVRYTPSLVKTAWELSWKLLKGGKGAIEKYIFFFFIKEYPLINPRRCHYKTFPVLSFPFSRPFWRRKQASLYRRTRSTDWLPAVPLFLNVFHYLTLSLLKGARGANHSPGFNCCDSWVTYPYLPTPPPLYCVSWVFEVYIGPFLLIENVLAFVSPVACEVPWRKRCKTFTQRISLIFENKGTVYIRFSNYWSYEQN